MVPGEVMSTDLTDGMTAPPPRVKTSPSASAPRGVKVNDANVVSADIMASNGVIHVIDSVILPPSMMAAASEMMAAAEERHCRSRSGDDDRPRRPPKPPLPPTSSTPPSPPAASPRWSPAVKAAGLVDTLKGEGPFTVFAPTDEAFAALPGQDTSNALLADPTAT